MDDATATGKLGSLQEDTKYFLKFALNVPYADVKRLVQSGARLLYSLRDCSRAGRVNWKLKLYRSESGPDATVAVYLKFEPQTFTESVRCVSEFVIRVAGPEGRGLERRSSSQREFSRRDDCWGWSQFARDSELAELVTSAPGDGVEHLKLSGVIRIMESSRLLYPRRRHNFARSQNGSDFRVKVALATFHVHRAVLAINSDHFAGLFARPDCLESRTGQAVLSEDRIQDVHLLLQFMYPGYTDVLDDASLVPLSRLAAKYQVHTLAWRCMQYMDAKLADPALLDADRAMMYYAVCQKYLHCPDLGEQCVRAAAGMPWRRVKDTGHFRELAEREKAAFLQTYLDFREAAGVRAATPQPAARAVEPTLNDAAAGDGFQQAGENSQLSTDTGLPATEGDSDSTRDVSDQ